jgi:hypothetical protein
MNHNVRYVQVDEGTAVLRPTSLGCQVQYQFLISLLRAGAALLVRQVLYLARLSSLLRAAAVTARWMAERHRYRT